MPYTKNEPSIDTVSNLIIRKYSTFVEARKCGKRLILSFPNTHFFACIFSLSCTFHNRTVVKLVMDAANIMHDMIVELWRDKFETELFEVSIKAAKQGIFIN